MSMLRRIWRRGLRNSPPHLPLPANYAKPYAMTKAFLPAVILATTGLALTPLMAVPQSNAAGAISRDYMVSSIATLILEGDIAATLIHDPRAKMIATGQPTDVDRLNIRRNGRSLRISMTQSGQTYQRKGPITLELRSADVEAITLNGGASLTVDRLDQQRITIGLFGSGALAVGEVKADRLRVNMVGNGAATIRKGQVGKADFILDGAARLDTGALSINEINVTSSGPTFITVAANSTAEIRAYGAGNITIGGRAPCRIPYAPQANVDCAGGVRQE
jgi:Putative auto-transporter adhesin, head GIN domain